MRLLPLGKIYASVSLAVVLSACSSTPIPEGADRIFGVSQGNNQNPFVPLVTLNGSNPATVDVFSTYVDAGAFAESLEDGIIPANEISVSGTLNTQVLGSYQLVFTATDSLGRVGQAVRTINVVDRTKPDILVNPSSQVIERRGYGNLSAPNYDLQVQALVGVQANDQYDGDISNQVNAQGAVLVDAEGDYPVVYNVADSSGNAADPKIRLIQVRDTIPPGLSIGNFSQSSITFSDSAQITIQFEDAAQIHEPFVEKISLVSVGGGEVPSCNLGVTGSGMQRIVTVSNCQGSGQVKLRVLPGAARDGTTLPGPNQTAQIDSTSTLSIANVAPEVFLGSFTPDALVKSSDTTSIAVSYSTAVTGTLSSNEVVSQVVSGSVACSISVTAGGSASPTIQLSNCQGNGQIRFQVAAGAVVSQGGSIPNLASAYTASLTVDNQGPGVILGSPSNPGPITSGTSVTFPVSYTEVVTGSVLDASEVALSVGSGLTCDKSVQNGATPTPTIVISNCLGNGTFSVRVNANAVQDLAGNGSSQSLSSPNIAVDNSGPTVSLNNPSYNPPLQNGFMISTSLATFGVSYSESVATANPLEASELSTTLTGGVTCNTTVQNGSTQSPSIRVQGCAGEGTYQVIVNANAVQDNVGNLNANPSSPSSILNIDTLGPRVTLGTPSDLIVKASDVSDIIATFTDMNLGSLFVSSSEVSLQTTGGANATKSVSCGTSAGLPGNQCRIRLTSFSGNGSIAVVVNANADDDIAGNPSIASSPSMIITVDTSAPQIRFATGTNPWSVPLCSTSEAYLTDGIEICEAGGGACVPVPGATLEVLSNNVNRLDSTNSYLVSFKAVDPAGNEGFSNRIVNVDGLVAGTTYQYGISSPDDLLSDSSRIRSVVSFGGNANFLLCNDIDFEDYAVSRPIGHPQGAGVVRSFKGIFEGQNYELRRFQISNQSTNSRTGLFAETDGSAVIRNLKVREIHVMSANDETGGVVGRNAGDLKRISVIDMALVEGKNRLGGIVGTNTSSGDLDECFSTAVLDAVDGSIDVGGLVGNNSGEIRDSFYYVLSGPSISGESLAYVGGITGRSSGLIERTYAVTNGLCALTSAANTGGIVGGLEGSGEVVDSLWDKDVAQSSVSNLCSEDPLLGAALTSLQMKTPSSYSSAWSNLIWSIQADAYADLLWDPLF